MVVVLAVTAMIVLAFLIPLARLIDDFARDRGVTLVVQEAEALARAVALVGTDNRAAAETLVAVGDPRVSRSIILETGVTVGPPAGAATAIGQARGGEVVIIEELGGVAAYVPVVGSSGGAVVRTWVGPDVLDRNVFQAWLALGALGLGLLALAAFVADRLARSIVRPVEELAAAATRFGDGDLSTRVVPAGPDELRTVGRVFNRIGDRLDHLLRSEREAVADLSHRLRTPLTAMQLEAEQLGQSEQAERMREVVAAMQREVDHLIREARRPLRTDAGHQADLARIARDRAAFWEPLITDQGREFTIDVPNEPVLVAGNPSDIEAAVDALVGNVIAHTNEGVPVWVEVHRDPPSLVVADGGPGFEASAIERGVSAAGSTGLGLDIARRTAEGSGGSIELGHRPEGGARVHLRFGSEG